MQTATGLMAPTSSQRMRLDVGDHPVFQALPADARRRIEETGCTLSLAAGEAVPSDGGLYFILSGVAGLFPAGGRICVEAVTAGSVHGWEEALGPGARRPQARILIDARVCRVPAASLVDVMGRDWLTRLVARHATARLGALAAEAACNAVHLVPERLAKWILRLQRGGNGAPLLLTQADFGSMLGVQRTSVNAAARRLQTLGLVHFGRGKVQVLNLGGLHRASCGCGDATAPVSSGARPSSQRPEVACEPRSWSSGRPPATRRALAAPESPAAPARAPSS